MPDLWFAMDPDEKTCPVHGQTLAYVDPQPDDFDLACLLECIIDGCDYQTREGP